MLQIALLLRLRIVHLVPNCVLDGVQLGHKFIFFCSILCDLALHLELLLTLFELTQSLLVSTWAKFLIHLQVDFDFRCLQFFIHLLLEVHLEKLQILLVIPTCIDEVLA